VNQPQDSAAARASSTSEDGAPAVPGSAAHGDLADLTFDAAFDELQRVVAELEQGGQPLEGTITRYERAVALQRHCERLLSEAQLRVQQLMARPGGGLGTVDVHPDEASEE
jgi:exodeoxyribonuclease VII small subunit